VIAGDQQPGEADEDRPDQPGEQSGRAVQIGPGDHHRRSRNERDDRHAYAGRADRARHLPDGDADRRGDDADTEQDPLRVDRQQDQPGEADADGDCGGQVASGPTRDGRLAADVRDLLRGRERWAQAHGLGRGAEA
jgi:hypothetical protein